MVGCFSSKTMKYHAWKKIVWGIIIEPGSLKKNKWDEQPFLTQAKKERQWHTRTAETWLDVLHTHLIFTVMDHNPWFYNESNRRCFSIYLVAMLPIEPQSARRFTNHSVTAERCRYTSQWRSTEFPRSFLELLEAGCVLTHILKWGQSVNIVWKPQEYF